MADNRSIHKFKHGDKFHDRYTLDRLIGSGGFADVWKAIDEVTNTIVALKIYTNLDEDGIKDLSEEYVRMKSLNHTNILRADFFDTWGNIPYLVMKLCEGGSLNKQVGQMNDDEILKVIKEMAEGLKYLHECGIIHQDIKPANILIDVNGTNKHYVLSDFGISSKTKTKLSRSVNQNDKGTSMTEAYAPPEKFSSKREERKPDRKGDIFSLGISIYELATGNMPFDDLPTGRQLLHDEDMDVDFDDIKDERVRRIVELCMQRNKDDRPTAAELSKMVDDDDLPEVPEREHSSSKRTVRVKDESSSSGIGKYLLIAVIALAVGAIGYFALFAPSSGSDEDTSGSSFVQEVDTFTINGYHLEMVKIPGGTFKMGTNSTDAGVDECERPERERKVSDFYMSKYEVPQKLWFSIMNKNPSSVINDNYPVNNVSWDDCQQFISKLNAITGRNFRLPTEAEWEYAAKAKVDDDGNISTRSNTYSGTSSSPEKYAWYASNSDEKLHAIGEKKPNALGLYDMSGNVVEWCQDMFTNYSTGNVELDNDQRVIRGGYYGSDVDAITCTSRGSHKYNASHPAIGLRLCLQ